MLQKAVACIQENFEGQMEDILAFFSFLEGLKIFLKRRTCAPKGGRVVLATLTYISTNAGHFQEQQNKANF